MRKRMPKSLRKFIRKEKARIRREVLDIKEREKLISQIYQRFSNEPENDKKTDKKDKKVKKPKIIKSNKKDNKPNKINKKKKEI